MHSPEHSSRRAFSLIEAAIVLGIIGLVIGGIWAAAATVQASHKRAQGVTALGQIVTYVRSIYTGQDIAADIDITPALAMRTLPGITPNQATNGATNPWGGAVTLGLVMSNGPPTQIWVTMTNLPFKACIDMTTLNTSPAQNLGLGLIQVNGAQITTFPNTISTARTTCAATNSVSWAYQGLK